MTGAFSRAFNDELHFDGKKLRWLNDEGQTIEEWDAASGRAGRGQNSRFQGAPDFGPIPEGEWGVPQGEYQDMPEMGTVDSLKSSVGRGAWPGGQGSWSRQRIWLQAQSGTNTYGRSGFTIHGGSSFGLAGCIDLAGGMDRFAIRFRQYGSDMRLTVDY